MLKKTCVQNWSTQMKTCDFKVLTANAKCQQNA